MEMGTLASEQSNEDQEFEEVVESFHVDKDIKEDQDRMIEEKEVKAEGIYWLSHYALKRVRANQNFVMSITGSTGGGKSYSAMKLGLDMDRMFDIDRIVFEPVDFARISNMDLRKGSVILWEEVGVGISSRRWYSQTNQLISSIMETFRRDNLILIMTVPNVRFIDSRIRSMLHGYGEMIDPTFTGGRFGWMKYLHVVVNYRSGKIMYRYPRIRRIDGRRRRLKGRKQDGGNIWFDLPPEELLEIYEEKKKEYVEKQKEKAIEDLSPDIEISPYLDMEGFMDMFYENPRKYGFIREKDDKLTLTSHIEHAWVLIQLDYRDFKKSKKEMVSALRFVRNAVGHKAQRGAKSIKDNELDTIFKLHRLYRGNYSAIARSINTSQPNVKKKIEEWKESGAWQQAENETDTDSE